MINNSEKRIEWLRDLRKDLVSITEQSQPKYTKTNDEVNLSIVKRGLNPRFR